MPLRQIIIFFLDYIGHYNKTQRALETVLKERPYGFSATETFIIEYFFRQTYMTV